jgi:hypothetical protein
MANRLSLILLFYYPFAMKKITFQLVSLSLALFLVISCKEKGKSGTGDAYTLKMVLAKGDTFSHDMDMTMKMGMEVKGRKMDMNMGFRGITTFKVIDVTDEFKEMSMTYSAMQMTADIAGMEDANDMLANNDAGRKLNGKSIKMKLNNKNEIIDVQGMDELMLDDSMDAATQEQIKKMLSKDQMNSIFGLAFQMYPDKPVTVGESWEKITDVNVAGINMKTKNTFTLNSVKDGIANLKVEGKLDGKGNMQQGETNMEMEVNGKQDGTIDINLADGLVVGSAVVLDANAGLKMMGQSVPMKLKGNYLMKRK